MLQFLSLTFASKITIMCSMKNDAQFSVTLKEVADIAAGFPLRGSADALDEGVDALRRLRQLEGSPPDLRVFPLLPGRAAEERRAATEELVRGHHAQTLRGEHVEKRLELGE